MVGSETPDSALRLLPSRLPGLGRGGISSGTSRCEESGLRPSRPLLPQPGSGCGIEIPWAWVTKKYLGWYLRVTLVPGLGEAVAAFRPPPPGFPDSDPSL